MTSEERELDLQLGDMIRENHILKQRLDINSSTFTPSATWPFPKTLPSEKEIQRRLRMQTKRRIEDTEDAPF
jgi:hypothetical protein